MSSHKTERFQLHTWEAGDDFLRAEFNENFAAIDQAARVVCGSYMGSGELSQGVALGFTPSAVFVLPEAAMYGTGYRIGIALKGEPVMVEGSVLLLEIEEGGFRAYYQKGKPSSSNSSSLNSSATPYRFLAVW